MTETTNKIAMVHEMSPRKQVLKLVLELGPLLVFFFTNSKFGIFAATGVFMVAVIGSLIASRMVFGKLPAMPLITGVFVLVFGGLTLYLQDETFIKLKPTIVNVLFGFILLGGLVARKLIWKLLFGDVYRLTDEGWRQMQLAWGVFFFILAGLNEYVWRNFSTDTWVSFKSFGILPLTMVFGLAMLPILSKHTIDDDES